MATYRFPVLVWQDHAGWFTAALVEWEDHVGIGRTPTAALEQLHDYLAWLYAEKPWWLAPDFFEPRLLAFTVPIRPEYETCERVYPCPETFPLRVIAVQGRQEGGLRQCALPTLRVRFYYHEDDALPNLVAHYVQQRLEGLTPQQLSRFLPPKDAVLDEVVVQGVLREKRRREKPEFEALSATAEPFTERRLRRHLSRAWERDREVEAVVRKLGAERANVLVVGEPGSGKTTVLAEAAAKLDPRREADRAEEGIPGKRFWLTAAARLISGMQYLGQWEARCEAIVAELRHAGGVLCVENLLDLVRAGDESPTASVAAFFLPYLQRGELRLATEATPAELDAVRRLLPGMADVFQVVTLPEFDRGRAVAVLDRLATQHRQNLHIEPGRGVVDLVYHLFRRFVPYQVFPGRAAAFLTEVFHRARDERRTELTADDVVRHFVRRTGLPELFLRDEARLDHATVLDHFRGCVIGQEEPCRVAADLVTTFKAGLNDPGRPVGVLLFCGPTGVGKTELAKALARYFFGHGESPERLLRLDMSEYGGPGSGERLLMGPNGEPSEAVRKLRQQPFCVLLLDEIEKADAEVFDVLLSAFDEGRLTDRYGRVTTLRSAVIVMTSNLGAGNQESFGFGGPPEGRYESEAMAFFRPEFFNRLDAVVTFEPLGRETVRAITRKELAELGRREGLARAGLRLTWSERLVDHLAQVGFDARYGARPLQRTVETTVVTALARFLLGHLGLRDTVVRADRNDAGAVEFTT